MTENSEEQIGIWNTSSLVATPLGTPLLTLRAPNHDAPSMRLCKTMPLLAIPGKMGDVDVSYMYTSVWAFHGCTISGHLLTPNMSEIQKFH